MIKNYNYQYINIIPEANNTQPDLYVNNSIFTVFIK